MKPDSPVRKSPAVDEFLATLSHPLAAEVRLLRETIRRADPRLLEGIKWNAPSFHFHDWFATFHLRSAREVVLILHRGAKTKAPLKTRFVSDPTGLVSWITPDRGKVTFTDAATIKARTADLQSLIRAWLAALDADRGEA